ncbi:MAG: ferric reductase-like transmembrane domain-containing protein [Xanthobacter sp.]
MRKIKLALWGFLLLLSLLWLWADPAVFEASGYFPLRGFAIQYTGILAMGVMSLGMILALRPRWPERRLGGLDKMYRLHKWLGITALVVAIMHWIWAQGTKWAVGWGWLVRPPRGARAPIENPVEAALSTWRGTAESWGEWTFYAVLVLLTLALVKWFPYRLFYKTHRLLALTYLILVFHTVVLMKYAYWSTPIGWVMALLLAGGTYGAIITLIRRVGASRQVEGTLVSLTHFPGVRALESVISLPQGWPGHRPGQFAFALSDSSEGAHPYTIASSWNDAERCITFITKGLGDHTNHLPEKLKVGQKVRIEGPYGCFTFDDNRPRQIWIGAGIGITPFIARMKHMALQAHAPDWPTGQQIDLFHTTGDVDKAGLELLVEDARKANVRLHLLISGRDGRLNGEKIRTEVPHWQEASLWFCGPVGFGTALRQDFAAHGLPVDQRFHQELFEMR